MFLRGALPLVLPVFVVPTSLFAGENWEQIRFDPGVRSEVESRAPIVGSWIVQNGANEILLSVTKTEAGALIAVGDAGAVFRSTDEGKNWDPVEKVTDSILLGVVATKSGTLIAVGDAGTVLRSVDEGAHWEEVAKTTHSTLLSIVSVAKSGTVVAVGNRGAILRSIDDGKSWRQVHSDAHATLWGVAAAEMGTLIAVGDRGTKFRSTDDGNTWSASGLGGADLWSVAASGVGTFVAVGVPVLATATPRRFSTVMTPAWCQDLPSSTLRNMLPRSTLIAVGDQGTILRSTNDGRFWTLDRSKGKSSLNSVTAISHAGPMLARLATTRSF
jgi:photosystem II stability/assembly factor-like uncharacterized protein